MQLQNHWTETESSRLTKSNFTTCRWYNTEHQRETNEPILEPLLPNAPLILAPKPYNIITNRLAAAFKINFPIDSDFYIDEFLEGANYSISFVSKALENQNYELLEGLVAEETIEVLKKKVDSLTGYQRSLITVLEENIYISQPIAINVTPRQNQDIQEHIVEIGHVCYYKPGSSLKDVVMQDVIPLMLSGNYCVTNYRFKRTYKNSVGGSWMITVANHFSFKYADARRD